MIGPPGNLNIPPEQTPLSPGLMPGTFIDGSKVILTPPNDHFHPSGSLFSRFYQPNFWQMWALNAMNFIMSNQYMRPFFPWLQQFQTNFSAPPASPQPSVNLPNILPVGQGTAAPGLIPAVTQPQPPPSPGVAPVAPTFVPQLPRNECLTACVFLGNILNNPGVNLSGEERTLIQNLLDNLQEIGNVQNTIPVSQREQLIQRLGNTMELLTRALPILNRPGIMNVGTTYILPSGTPYSNPNEQTNYQRIFGPQSSSSSLVRLLGQHRLLMQTDNP